MYKPQIRKRTECKFKFKTGLSLFKINRTPAKIDVAVTKRTNKNNDTNVGDIIAELLIRVTATVIPNNVPTNVSLLDIHSRAYTTLTESNLKNVKT